MLKLIEECLADHGQAWAELWLIYDDVAAKPVRALLVRAGFDPSEADDLAQEIYMHLHENDNARLRSFRGETQRDLAIWLGHLAVNFTRNWIVAHRRAEKREKKAFREFPESERDGPTEADIDSLLRELEGWLSPDDFHLLQSQLAAETGPNPEPTQPDSRRTQRRRLQHLVDIVREFLGLR
jgi:DNA-directed RNA polymerase specialized sigma24 family protein